VVIKTQVLSKYGHYNSFWSIRPAAPADAAHLDNKAIFIDGALPGDIVRFRYTARRSQHDEGMVETVGNPSPDGSRRVARISGAMAAACCNISTATVHSGCGAPSLVRRKAAGRRIHFLDSLQRGGYPTRHRPNLRSMAKTPALWNNTCSFS